MYALEGIQYRTLAPGSNYYGANGRYSAWSDVTENIKAEFPEGTQFRVRPPKFQAKVTANGPESILVFDDEEELAGHLTDLVGKGNYKSFTVVDQTVPSPIVNSRLEYSCYIGREIWGDWNSTDLTSLPQASRIRFRLRPDHKYDVRTGINGSYNSVTFDDVDRLVKHINRVLAENSIDSLSVIRGNNVR